MYKFYIKNINISILIIYKIILFVKCKNYYIHNYKKEQRIIL